MLDEERIAEVMRDEADKPICWWYLSFAGEDGFHGACIVAARGITSALLTCNILGINPHGEVRGAALPWSYPIPTAATNCLLTEEDIERFFGETIKWL